MSGGELLVGLIVVAAALAAWTVGHALTIIQEGMARPSEPALPPPEALRVERRLEKAREREAAPPPSPPAWTKAPSGPAAALRARDPLFDEDAFLTRAKLVFEAVERGWSAQDMGRAACFLSAGFAERCAIQAALRAQAGRPAPAVHDRFEAAALLSVDSTPAYDAAHAQLRAAAADGDVAEVVLTFLRRVEARTRPVSDLLASGRCPNCGGPVLATDGARCSACGSWLDAGLFDWVLAFERPAWAWEPREAGVGAPGLSQARHSDPELDARALEDRALVAFWRWQEGLATGDLRAFAALCPERCAQLASGERRPADGREPEAVVVELVSVAEAGLRQRAEVLVRWTPDRVQEARRFIETIFVLERAAGARTQPRCGLQSLRCPTCGAPPAGRDETRCAYCGAQRRGAESEWLLVEVDTRG